MPWHISQVILVRGKRLLLELRAQNRAKYPGCWAVPGGHFEPGEAAEQAAVREIQEELGVTVTDLRGLQPISFVHANGPGVIHMFATSQWIGGEPSRQSDEISELRWFYVEEACNLDSLALYSYRASFRSLAQIGY